MRMAFCLLAVLLPLTMVHAQTKRPMKGAKPKAAEKMPEAKNVAPDIERRLARFKPVEMPFHAEGLSAREKQLVNKLVEACRYIEDIYWRQSDPEGLDLYEQLAGADSARMKALRQYIYINAGRWDLLEENETFVGTDPYPPGHALYPKGVTRAEIEQYVKAHPGQKDAIYSGTAVVRRDGDKLTTVSYHVAYRSFLEPAAKALREAAALTDDKAFEAFLRGRAEALLSDDYYPSDLAWVDLKDPKFDIIYAPYETYLDDLMGVKGSYGAAVLVRNEAESKKLAIYQRYIADLQDALPIAAEDRPSKKGHLSPMEVMDAPYRTGDLNHGYQAVADNLPNDPRIHQEKGTKKIFFKNFMDARVNFVILPIARKLLRADQASLATADGYMSGTLMHEISHGLGPSFSRVSGKRADIREAIGPTYSGLEEAKADIVGLFCLHWLVEHGDLPKERLPEFYVSHVAGLLRTVRFSIAEAHGKAEMMEFNYLSEQKAIERQQDGRYAVAVARMPDAIAALAKELLEIEATGDRQRAEQWFAKYDQMPPDLKAALKTVSDVPVDITPKFSWPDTPR